MTTTTVEANPADVLKQVDQARERGELEPARPRQTLVQSEQARREAPQASYGFSGNLEELGPLFAALAKAQGEFGKIERTLTAKIASRKGEGSSFTYDYAPLSEVLEAVRKPLSDNGIVVTSFPTTRVAGSQTGVTVKTVIAHSSGKAMWCDLTLASVSTDPKDIGGAITYARRYALMALLNIAPDHDDDANAAGGREAVVTPRGQQPQPKKDWKDGLRWLKVGGIQAAQIQGGKAWRVKLLPGDHTAWTDDEVLVGRLRLAMNAGAELGFLVEQRKVGAETRWWIVETREHRE